MAKARPLGAQWACEVVGGFRLSGPGPKEVRIPAAAAGGTRALRASGGCAALGCVPGISLPAVPDCGHWNLRPLSAHGTG